MCKAAGLRKIQSSIESRRKERSQNLEKDIENKKSSIAASGEISIGGGGAIGLVRGEAFGNYVFRKVRVVSFAAVEKRRPLAEDVYRQEKCCREPYRGGGGEIRLSGFEYWSG